MTVLDRERALYEEMWQVEGYATHSPGASVVPLFLEMTEAYRPDRPSVLDAGCGSGKGAVALAAHGFDVTMCDLTSAGLVPEAKSIRYADACLWKPLRPQLPYAPMGAWDFVYCCDVLEHVPPEFTMLVIRQLLDVARVGVFLNISLVPDRFGVHVGTALHQSVFRFTWWRDRLNELGTVRECRDLLSSGVFWVTP